MLYEKRELEKRPVPVPARARFVARSALFGVLVASAVPSLAEGTWRGLVVAPEHRCSDYDSGDYRYSPSLEERIVSGLGEIFSPYTNRCFEDTRDTDIEHIVARSEAHDSGLCAADATRRREFAADLANLTLASPEVNRRQKGAKDAAGWLPAQNRCWFAARIVDVRRKYDLTIDEREVAALEPVLANCASSGLVAPDCGASSGTQPLLRGWRLRLVSDQDAGSGER